MTISPNLNARYKVYLFSAKIDLGFSQWRLQVSCRCGGRSHDVETPRILKHQHVISSSL